MPSIKHFKANREIYAKQQQQTKIIEFYSNKCKNSKYTEHNNKFNKFRRAIMRNGAIDLMIKWMNRCNIYCSGGRARGEKTILAVDNIYR